MPIRADRLDAALKRDGLTVTAFARQHRLSQQTLDYIVRGKTKRCRRKLAERVADKLAVPVEWLTGERNGFDSPQDLEDLDETDDRYLAMFPLAWRALMDQVEETGRRECLPRAARDRISLALMHLTDARMWRWTLFGGAPKPYIPAGFEPEEGARVQAQLDDRLRATLADALSAILQPWFSKEATLNVRALTRAAPKLRKVSP